MSDVDGSQVRHLAEDRKIESESKSRPRIGPLDVRLQLYEDVLELRRKSRSYKEIIAEIAQKHHVTLGKSTVSYWVNKDHTPLGGINFFEPKPAPELAYVIGVLVGDASLNVRAKNHEYRIRLKAVDREFVQAFNVAISKVLNRRPHKIWKGNTERESYADVSSYLLHKFLNRPLDEFRPFIEYNAKCVSAFLRGFFDSEGSVAKDGDVTASNTDVDLLKYVQDLSFRFFGIETTGPHVGKKKGSVLIRRGKTYYRNSDVCVIRVRRVSLELFDEFIGLTIHRKVSRRELAMIRYKFRMKHNAKL